MIKLTSLFWDCECEHRFVHRAHEIVCPQCGARREDQPDSHIAELLTYFPEILTPDEISAFERAIKPVNNEIWQLIVYDNADGGSISVREVSKSMLEIEEAYTRRAEELGVPWSDELLDYNWADNGEICSVYGIDTTIGEVI